MSPTIFRTYDQAALDRQYNNLLKVAPGGFQQYQALWAEQSARARATINCVRDLAYGGSALENLDIFMPETAGPHPVQIYIHGGYWRSGDKNECSYVATGFTAADIVTVVINYGLAPAVRLQEQVQQCVVAVNWVKENIARYRGDPERIYVTGHSAGGHLAAMLVAAPSDGAPPSLAPGTIKGICALSGVYDLEPVRLSYVNETLRLTEADVAMRSPARAGCVAGTRILIGVGEREGDEYLRQSRELACQWLTSASEVTLVVSPEDEHFSIRTHLGNRQSNLCHRIFAFMAIDHCFEKSWDPPAGETAR